MNNPEKKAFPRTCSWRSFLLGLLLGLAGWAMAGAALWLALNATDGSLPALPEGAYLLALLALILAPTFSVAIWRRKWRPLRGNGCLIWGCVASLLVIPACFYGLAIYLVAGPGWSGTL